MSDFYTDLKGGRVYEIVLLLLLIPLGFYACRSGQNQFFFWVAPLLYQLTLASRVHGRPWQVEKSEIPHPPMVAFLLPLAVGAWAWWSSRFVRVIPQKLVKKRAFVTFYRASMMLATVFAILAVDFDVFPRRFAKTETFGHALMDAGVGGFVFSMGVVAHDRIGRPLVWWDRMRLAVRQSLPLWVLGVARLMLVHGVALDGHVSEYGVHWNFFMTLATITLVAALMDVGVGRGALLGVFLLVAYQTVLSVGGGTEYVLDHPRTNLIHANKEGLCSWIGFLGLFLVARACGRYVLHADFRSPDVLGRGGMMVGALFAGAWILDAFVQAPSRRMANLSYVVECMALNAFVLWTCAVVQAGTSGSAAPSLADAINNNALFVFLIANLTTGAVNLSMDTVAESWGMGMLVLTIYAVWICLVALLLDKKL